MIAIYVSSLSLSLLWGLLYPTLEQVVFVYYVFFFLKKNRRAPKYCKWGNIGLLQEILILDIIFFQAWSCARKTLATLCWPSWSTVHGRPHDDDGLALKSMKANHPSDLVHATLPNLILPLPPSSPFTSAILARYQSPPTSFLTCAVRMYLGFLYFSKKNKHSLLLIH